MHDHDVLCRDMSHDVDSHCHRIVVLLYSNDSPAKLMFGCKKINRCIFLLGDVLSIEYYPDAREIFPERQGNTMPMKIQRWQASMRQCFL